VVQETPLLRNHEAMIAMGVANSSAL
jgi:hypothetical protein